MGEEMMRGKNFVARMIIWDTKEMIGILREMDSKCTKHHPKGWLSSSQVK